MLDKIVLALLISLAYSEIANLTLKYIDSYQPLDLDGLQNGLVCIRINDDFKKDDNFYVFFSSQEKGKKMNKTIYYNLTKESCQNLGKKEIDFNDLSNIFKYKDDKPNLETEENGFSYEYKITKKEDDQKFMLLLFKDFNGNQLKVQYSPFSATGILIIVIIIIGVIIFFIIIIIVIICICCRKRKQKQLPQYQTSYVQEPIMPEENNTQ